MRKVPLECVPMHSIVVHDWKKQILFVFIVCHLLRVPIRRFHPKNEWPNNYGFFVRNSWNSSNTFEWKYDFCTCCLVVLTGTEQRARWLSKMLHTFLASRSIFFLFFFSLVTFKRTYTQHIRAQLRPTRYHTKSSHKNEKSVRKHFGRA